MFFTDTVTDTVIVTDTVMVTDTVTATGTVTVTPLKRGGLPPPEGGCRLPSGRPPH